MFPFLIVATFPSYDMADPFYVCSDFGDKVGRGIRPKGMAIALAIMATAWGPLSIKCWMSAITYSLSDVFRSNRFLPFRCRVRWK